jgi:hypothetical protein
MDLSTFLELSLVDLAVLHMIASSYPTETSTNAILARRQSITPSRADGLPNLFWLIKARSRTIYITPFLSAAHMGHGGAYSDLFTSRPELGRVI